MHVDFIERRYRPVELGTLEIFVCQADRHRVLSYISIHIVDYSGPGCVYWLGYHPYKIVVLRPHLLTLVAS